MLQRYYGFSREPFGPTPDPQCLYPTPTHREALASLKYGFSSGRGFTALIAPPGMGKTTLLFRFLDDIRESARTVFLFDIDNQCDPRELVGYILRDIGVTPAHSRAEMHAQLKSVLVAEARAGRKFAVVIDEAQNLSDAALETVRLLSNFETPRAKLIQIVLSGQPQLSDTLMRPSLLQLRQRISTLCRIEPLSAEEVCAYVDHRLKAAGYRGERLFTQEALNLIAEKSQGVPRTINNLCFNALSLCCALRRREVDGHMVREAIRDQQVMPESAEAVAAPLETSAGRPYEPEQRRQAGVGVRLWTPAVALLLFVSALSVLGLSRFRTVRWNKAAGAPPSDTKVGTAQEVAPAPAGTSASEAVAADSVVGANFLGLMVQPGRTLRSIGVQYAGRPDIQSLRPGQTLNHRLLHADNIDAGQSNWLPGSAVPEETATSPANVRDLP